MTGSATLNAVPSIDTMLEPRIVAARIQGLEDPGQTFSSAGVATITPRSQGPVRITLAP